LADLEKNPAIAVWETVKMRWDGLNMLRKRLTDKALDYQSHGGFELFANKTDYQRCLESLSRMNSSVNTVLGLSNCYAPDDKQALAFGKTVGTIKNKYEGQLDTG